MENTFSLSMKEEIIYNGNGQLYNGLEFHFETMNSMTHRYLTRSLPCVKIVGIEVASIFFRHLSTNSLFTRLQTMSAVPTETVQFD